MGRTVGRLLICLPPALAVGLFFMARESAGLEPAVPVQLVSATVPAPLPSSQSQDVLPADHGDAHGLPDGPKYVGAAGCAAANCHGGSGLNQVQGSEHSIWIQKDPHANAFSLLYEEPSRNIIKLLKNSPRYAQMLGDTQAHETRLCLDCHSVAPHKSKLAEGHKFSLRDGVSCEGCHGPAELWLDSHKRYDWQDKSPEEKASLGFWDTDNLLVRAQTCADCHVGSKYREVNHDLMAAGHPRLTFEMSAYFDNLPPHWNPNEDRRLHALNNPSLPAAELQSAFEAKLWATGQLAVAEKSVELLKERAENKYKVWPEFTEYGCYACHHNLQPAGWRQERGFPNRRPGHYPWGTWQFPVVPEISRLLLPQQPNPFLDENGVFQQLKAEMGRPLPDRQKAAMLAGELERELEQLGITLDKLTFSQAEIQSLFQKMVSKEGGQSLVGQNWDAAAQVYLATVALYQGLADAQGRVLGATPEDQAVYDHFKVIRENLKFPVEKTDLDSPAIYNSPKTYEENAPNHVQIIKSQLDGINHAIKP